MDFIEHRGAGGVANDPLDIQAGRGSSVTVRRCNLHVFHILLQIGYYIISSYLSTDRFC